MLPPDQIAHAIQEALALVTLLVEGGIDPFASSQGAQTIRALLAAQVALETAERLWQYPQQGEETR